jgi:hypothetical protein
LPAIWRCIRRIGSVEVANAKFGLVTTDLARNAARQAGPHQARACPAAALLDDHRGEGIKPGNFVSADLERRVLELKVVG